jgi:hypothetical protein
MTSRSEIAVTDHLTVIRVPEVTGLALWVLEILPLQQLK